MDRIKFKYSYKSHIVNGICKVVTSAGNPVRIICWDRKGVYPIIGLIDLDGEAELLREFKADGTSGDGNVLFIEYINK